MAYESLPHRHYQRIADALEQTAAMLPRDQRSGMLRSYIETAIETAVELAYTPHAGLRLVHSRPDITGGRQGRDA